MTDAPAAEGCQSILDFQGRPRMLYPGIFWHVSPQSGSPLFNNAFLGKGVVTTISAINKMPGMAGALTPYAMKVRTDPKEIVWERVRREINPRLPTRDGALFLVRNEEEAKNISAKWFPGENRHLLRAQIIIPSGFWCCDAQWLNANEEKWEQNAHRYWKSEMSDDPKREWLVDGAVYFLDWEKPPFGKVFFIR